MPFFTDILCTTIIISGGLALFALGYFVIHFVDTHFSDDPIFKKLPWDGKERRARARMERK